MLFPKGTPMLMPFSSVTGRSLPNENSSCKHCGAMLSKHAERKCLFESTEYTASASFPEFVRNLSEFRGYQVEYICLDYDYSLRRYILPVQPPYTLLRRLPNTGSWMDEILGGFSKQRVLAVLDWGLHVCNILNLDSDELEADANTYVIAPEGRNKSLSAVLSKVGILRGTGRLLKPAPSAVGLSSAFTLYPECTLHPDLRPGIPV